jgi:hypothetical protein
MARPSLPRNVKLLGLASLFNDIASEMIYPLLPQFLLGMLGGSRFFLGIIEGVADSVASLLKLWAGAWSDRAGRRKGFVVAGYTLASLARPLVALTTAPWQLLLVRFADRVGKGLRTAPRDALIADSAVAEIRGRAFGFQRALDHVGAAIGPLLATAFLLVWPGQLRVLFPAYGLFYALTEPAERVLVARLAAPEFQGLAYGWYNFAIGVAALPSSLIFGFLYQRFGGLAAFGSGAGLALLAAVLLLGVRPPGQS